MSKNKCLLILVLCGLISICYSATIYTGWDDNFNDGAQQTWTIYDYGQNSTYNVTNNRYELHTEGTETPGALASYVDFTVADCYLQSRVQRISEGDNFLAYLVARGAPLSGNCYVFGASSDGEHKWFGKIAVGVYSELTPCFISATSVNPADFQMKFAVIGESLFGKVWTTGTTEPSSWQIKARDVSYSSGIAGIMVATYPTFNWNVVQAAFDDVSLRRPIQEAVNAASADDIIQVAPGIYNETVTFSGAPVDNLTISGDPLDRPIVNGGVKFANTSAFSGLTLEYLYFMGNAGNNRIFEYQNTAAINDFTMDNCVLDGENVSIRDGIYGNKHGQSFSITNTEFKDILGCEVMDLDVAYGPPYGGNELVLTNVTFANNYVHECNGSVALRGNHDTKTTTVNVYGNTITNIGGNQSTQGEQWAGIEVNHAVTVSVYDNLISNIIMGIWDEGEAFQFWDVTTLNMYDNSLTNNYQGIYICGYSLGSSYGGPYAVPSGSVYHNNISGNDQYGLSVEITATGGPLDAKYNWWGHNSGPYHATSNPSGLGNSVSDNVDYNPWLGAEPGTTPSMVYYLNPGSSIQGVINMASSGDWIHLLAGEFTGDVVFSTTPVTLALGASPAQVILNGNLTFTTAVTFEIELNGTTAGSEYDQLQVNGTVNLDNAKLVLDCGFNPPVGTEFTIIANDGEDAIAGFFAGLGEGAKITSSGVGFTISYTGGPGNDVVLTVVAGWARTEPMPVDSVTGRSVKEGGAMAAVTGTDENDYIYAFKGWNSQAFYKYDVAGNSWQALTPIPFGYRPTWTTVWRKKPGKGASLCWNGGNIIYATKGNNTREFWAYDIEQNAWEQKEFLPYPPVRTLKGGTSIVWYQDKVYLLAGGQKKDSANFFAYDPTTNAWNSTPLEKAPYFGDPLKPRVYKDGSCLAVMGDKIYALKGGDKYNYLAKCEYTGEPPNWSWLSSAAAESIPSKYPIIMIARPRKALVKDGAAMISDGTYLYAIKGGGKQDFWKFTTGAPGSWTALDTIPKYLKRTSMPKTGAALAYVNPYIYLLKGNKTPEFWRYNIPASDPTQISPVTNNAVMSEKISSLFSINVTPNPVTRMATICYTVPINSKVSIKLYNASGRLIKTLIDEYQNAGSYSLEIRNSKLEIPNGVYFLKYSDRTNSADVKIIIQ